MTIFSIVGARPQFIKLAPLSEAIGNKHKEYIVHTGQHYDYAMSEKIFTDLGIRQPDIHLDASTGSQTEQITQMMLKLETAMLAIKPDVVIVFGDTNSTLAGALIAAKQNIPIIHIEAGLRSFNRAMPEEVNRIMTDHVSKYLFAPTQTAVNHLTNEGLANSCYFTGDIMVDTIKTNLKIAQTKSKIVEDFNLQGKDFNLLTLHRNYNVDDTTILENILSQLGGLNEKIIFPVHPRTRKMIATSFNVPENIVLVEPQGYLDFIVLENAAKRIITDSGGIQKEAYILKKPCITLRTETEWVETVSEKWNLLLSPSSKNITGEITAFVTPEKQQDIFGENVAEKMVKIIDSI